VFINAITIVALDSIIEDIGHFKKINNDEISCQLTKRESRKYFSQKGELAEFAMVEVV